MMSREKEGFRDQYQILAERFQGREAITLSESCQILGLDRKALLRTTDFPARKVGKRYIVPLAALARWMC